MRTSVSTQSILAVASVLSMSIVWLLFVLPATGAISGGLFGFLVVATAIWVGMRSTPIGHIGREPLRVTARPAKSVR